MLKDDFVFNAVYNPKEQAMNGLKPEDLPVIQGFFRKDDAQRTGDKPGEMKMWRMSGARAKGFYAYADLVDHFLRLIPEKYEAY